MTELHAACSYYRNYANIEASDFDDFAACRNCLVNELKQHNCYSFCPNLI